MPEPLTSVLLTKGATIAIDAIVAHLMAKADATLPMLKRIESDLHVLRTAFVDDALDCLREGDVAAYKKAAREAKNRNKLNPYARFLYVDALFREQNIKAASEALWECVLWHGLQCPLLSGSLREVLERDRAMDLRADEPVSVSIEAPNGMPGWTFKGVAACQVGVVTAWQHNYGMLNLTVGTMLTFTPWPIDGLPKTIEIYRDDGSSARPIYWLTDRILLHPFGPNGCLQAVDLTNPADRVNLNDVQAQGIFGDMDAPVGLIESGRLRDIVVEITERYVSIPSGSNWSPGNHGNVTQVKLTPPLESRTHD